MAMIHGVVKEDVDHRLSFPRLTTLSLGQGEQPLALTCVFSSLTPKASTFGDSLP